MQNIWFHLLSILLSFLPLIISQDKSITEIFINQGIKGSNIDNGYSYFKLVFPSISNPVDLLISVRLDTSSKEFSDPDLFVSRSQPFPSRTDYEWKSRILGQDIISISNKFTAKNSLFYVAVFCEKKCSFILNCTLSNEIIIEANQEFRYEFEKGDEKLLKYTAKMGRISDLGLMAYSETLAHFTTYVAIGI